MLITREITDAVEATSFSEDQKQEFYVWLLEQDEELIDPDQSRSSLRRTINQYMWNRAQNERWVENNRKRLLAEKEDEIRDMLTQRQKYAEDPMLLRINEEGVEEFLLNLSDTNRRTFDRLYLDGLTPEELASEEGVDRNAIDQRVHNIKKQLLGEV